MTTAAASRRPGAPADRWADGRRPRAAAPDGRRRAVDGGCAAVSEARLPRRRTTTALAPWRVREAPSMTTGTAATSSAHAVMHSGPLASAGTGAARVENRDDEREPVAHRARARRRRPRTERRAPHPPRRPTAPRRDRDHRDRRAGGRRPSPRRDSSGRTAASRPGAARPRSLPPARRLGSGAFGTVWWPATSGWSATSRSRSWPRERVVGGRFEREARAAARLSHPAIVTLYEAAVDDDGAYLVSELVAAPRSTGCSPTGAVGPRHPPDRHRAVRRARPRPRAGRHAPRRQAVATCSCPSGPTAAGAAAPS